MFWGVKFGGSSYLDIIERPSIYKSGAKMSWLLVFWGCFKKALVPKKIPLYLVTATQQKNKGFSNERHPNKGTEGTISKAENKIG